VQTTALWTPGVFSTTTRLSMRIPNSASADLESDRSRCLYAGSAQAWATTFAPTMGPMSFS